MRRQEDLITLLDSHSHSTRAKTEFVMEDIEKKSEQGVKFGKPSWLRRRLIWPLKTKVLRTLPFKVNRLSLQLCLCLVQVVLIGVGVSLYLLDVGLDVDSCIRWSTMNGCFRLVIGISYNQGQCSCHPAATGPSSVDFILCAFENSVCETQALKFLHKILDEQMDGRTIQTESEF